MGRLTSLEYPRTVSVPRMVLPSAQTCPSRKEMTGNRAASRNRANSAPGVTLLVAVLNRMSISA